MTHPDVSVVIPVHNRAHTVGDAIDSVLEQVDLEAEIIIVDDASSDGLEDTLARYRSQLRIIRCDGNIERGAARNLGAAIATAELVAFLDSDDLWHPTKLVRQLGAAADGTPCVTGLQSVSEDLRPLGSPIIPRPSARRRLTHGNTYPGSASSLLMSRELFLDVGGYPEDREIQGSEDWVLLVKLVQRGVDISVVDEPLTFRRIHASNDTVDAARVERARFAAIDWMFERELIDGAMRDLARAKTAGVLCRMHLAAGHVATAAKWARQSAGWGTPFGSFMSLAWGIGALGKRHLRKLRK